MNTNTAHQKDTGQHRMNPNPVVVGAVGAMVGATVTWLSDSQNRQKVSQVLEEAIARARSGAEDAKQIAADAIQEMEGKVDQTVQKGKKAAEGKLPEVREAAEAVKSTTDRAAKKTEQVEKEVS
jgi:hypothetical protein